MLKAITELKWLGLDIRVHNEGGRAVCIKRKSWPTAQEAGNRYWKEVYGK